MSVLAKERRLRELVDWNYIMLVAPHYLYDLCRIDISATDKPRNKFDYLTNIPTSDIRK